PQHVDEPRGHDLPLDVDPPLRLGPREAADRRDAAVADADVPRVPGGAGAVDDVAVGEDEVEGGLGGEGGRGEEEGENQGLESHKIEVSLREVNHPTDPSDPSDRSDLSGGPTPAAARASPRPAARRRSR